MKRSTVFIIVILFVALFGMLVFMAGLTAKRENVIRENFSGPAGGQR